MTNTTDTQQDNSAVQQIRDDLQEFPDETLENLQADIAAELTRRNHDIDLDAAENIDLINNRWANWHELSAHSNLKAVKPWIMKVTSTHDTYGVDGEWLDKQRIDDKYHMDVSDLTAGDIIRVSGASHNNKKHRYYRVVAVTDNHLYYTPKNGLQESDVMEEVGE